jgi:hypothetical protein
MPRKALKLRGGDLPQRLQGLHMGNVPEKSNTITFHYLSWIDAGNDFKM